MLDAVIRNSNENIMEIAFKIISCSGDHDYSKVEAIRFGFQVPQDEENVKMRLVCKPRVFLESTYVGLEIGWGYVHSKNYTKHF